MNGETASPSNRDMVAEVASDYADAEIKFAIGDVTELAEEIR